jgi:hypothetical protein
MVAYRFRAHCREAISRAPRTDIGSELDETLSGKLVQVELQAVL